MGFRSGVPNLEDSRDRPQGTEAQKPNRGLGLGPRGTAGQIFQCLVVHPIGLSSGRPWPPVRLDHRGLSCRAGDSTTRDHRIGPGRGPVDMRCRKQVRWGFPGQFSRAFCLNRY